MAYPKSFPMQAATPASLIVSPHPAMRDWLVEQEACPASTPIIPAVHHPSVLNDKTVFGNLSVHLAIRCASIRPILFQNLPSHLLATELSLQALREHACVGRAMRVIGNSHGWFIEEQVYSGVAFAELLTTRPLVEVDSWKQFTPHHRKRFANIYVSGRLHGRIISDGPAPHYFHEDIDGRTRQLQVRGKPVETRQQAVVAVLNGLLAPPDMMFDARDANVTLTAEQWIAGGRPDDATGDSLLAAARSVGIHIAGGRDALQACLDRVESEGAARTNMETSLFGMP